ncbi:MAG: hypothetical protein Q8O59_00975 [bacterium]|nr:hypothetical protein [bacterium]
MFITKKFKSILKYSLSVIFLSMFLVFVPVTADFTPVNQAKAESWLDTVNQGGLNDVGKAYSTNAPRDIRMIIVDIIKIVLGFLGIIATVIILYAGFKWMTSAGNEENVTSAKKMLVAGVIGLVIILSAYAIATFTISYLVGATTGAQVIWQ